METWSSIAFGLLAVTSGVAMWWALLRSAARAEPAGGGRWWDAGFEGHMTLYGPHMRMEKHGITLTIEPRSDGLAERRCLAVCLTHPDLGGPFALELGAPHTVGSSETGDGAFDAQAHLQTENPLAALAYLDSTRRDVLMDLVGLGSLRLVRGRLELLATAWSQAHVFAGLLDRAVQLLDTPRDPLPLLLGRLDTGRLNARLAVGRVLKREVGVLPEVRHALAASLLRAADVDVRQRAVAALGDAADHDALAADSTLPAAVRFVGWLGGTRDELPTDLVLDAACVARLKTTEHRARAELALASMEDASLLAAVQDLPASAARTAALTRIRARASAQAGGLSLPRPTHAGALRIADEVEKPEA